MKSAALDTRILIRLEMGDTVCEEVIDRLHKRQVYCIVTETVLDELYDYATHGSTHELKKLGKSVALRARRDFLTPPLGDLQKTFAETFANRLLDGNTLSGGCKNDGLVLAEAGLNNAIIFITDRPAFLEADFRGVILAVKESDLPAAVYMTPEEFLALDK